VSELVTIERLEQAAVIRLQRLDRENRLDDEMFEALRRAALKLSDAPPAAIIVTGSEDLFCAGLDFSPSNPTVARIEALSRNRDTYALAELIRGLRAKLDLLGRVNCPTIAAIEGPCHGAGLQLALTCDLRVASSTASFRLPETQMGALPFLGGLVRLSRLIGHGRTTDLVLTGREIDAATLKDWGVLNRVVPSGHALESAMELAETISKNPPQATKNALLALRQLNGADSDTYDIESETGARTLSSGDFTEAVLSRLDDNEMT
jgi:enoyl-CoA hydratase/carnithine racemase